MTETITSLHPRGKTGFPLARVDLLAVELLNEGRATTLRAARIEAALMDLREQRGRMAAVLDGLRGREPEGHALADADLITAIDRGIVQLDLFIARAGCLTDASARPESGGPSC